MKNQENKTKKTDIRKRIIVSLLVLSPLIITCEIIWITTILNLISEPSDFAVFLGMFLLSLFLLGNYFFFSTIFKKINKNKK